MKLNELWISFASNQLTSTVSLHALDQGTMVKISINGIIDGASSFITGVILAAMESGNHAYCLIDVRELLFVEGISINEHAIECLVRLAGYIMNHDTRGILVIDDSSVREVLISTLHRHRGLSRITIQSGRDFMDSGLAQET